MVWFLALTWAWACSNLQAKRAWFPGTARRRVGWSNAAPSSVSGVGGQGDCYHPLCLPLCEEEESIRQHVFQPEDDFVSWYSWKPMFLQPHVQQRVAEPMCLVASKKAEDATGQTPPYTAVCCPLCARPWLTPSGMLTGLSISMLCHVQIRKISKSSGLYARSGGTYLLSEYGVQISNVLAILKTSQVLLNHRTVIF